MVAQFPRRNNVDTKILFVLIVRAPVHHDASRGRFTRTLHEDASPGRFTRTLHQDMAQALLPLRDDR
jgi:hypothetical protein